MRNPVEPVSWRYGAPMGRASRYQGDVIPEAPPMHLRRVYLNRGGYDSGGAYWGLGAPLWYFENSEGDLYGYFRAYNREAAKAHIRADYPNARFFR